jgi:hypothetical protein
MTGGVDYAIARLYWLADGDAGWSPAKSVESYIQPDGTMRIVTFDLAASPAWNPAETVTGLQFEFTTTPPPRGAGPRGGDPDRPPQAVTGTGGGVARIFPNPFKINSPW